MNNDELDAGLVEANIARAIAAAERDVERAKRAIEIITAVPATDLTATEVVLRQKYLQVLRLRVGNPHKTLMQLGAKMHPKANKDVYSARLRRAFAFAERLERKAQ